MPEATFTDPVTWYSGLAGVVIAAGAIITNPDGHVLLVKPNYRDGWALPGGICEFGEPPHVGCARELAEELGLEIPVGRLLAVGWSQPFGAQERPIMHFVFDGGTLVDGAGIEVQEAELDGFTFIASAELPDYLPPHGLARVVGALQARETETVIYVPYQVL